MRRVIYAAFLVLWFGFAGRGTAQPLDGNEMFPDIPGAEKTVLHCDEGATAAITYTKPNEWRRTVIMTQLRPYATESKSNGPTYYFVLSSDGTKFLEISFAQFKSDMGFLSPNYVKHMDGEPSDCIDSKSLRQGM